MLKLLTRPRGWRLQYILMIGFAVTTAITVVVGALITYGLINSYLIKAQDTRVGRDMDLANAFYNGKLDDISATAGRIASLSREWQNLIEARQDSEQASQAIEAGIDNEIEHLPPGTQRFVVITDPEGIAVKIGRAHV